MARSGRRTVAGGHTSPEPNRRPNLKRDVRRSEEKDRERKAQLGFHARAVRSSGGGRRAPRALTWRALNFGDEMRALHAPLVCPDRLAALIAQGLRREHELDALARALEFPGMAVPEGGFSFYECEGTEAEE